MKDKLYLLGGNGSNASWWQDCLGAFQHYQAQAIELPGFGANRDNTAKDLDAYAHALLQRCQANQVIVACGISALIVLRASLIRPGYFKKILLFAPIGVFLWRRKLARFLSSAFVARIARILLSYAPALLGRLIERKSWSSQQRQKFSHAYRQCRAFSPLCKIITPANALQLLDTLVEEVHIIYGEKDRIANHRHAAAWESVLPRCRLSFSFLSHWTHYPYFEHSQDFAQTMESLAQGKTEANIDIDMAHSKAGRLLLAQRAGIKTPRFWLAKRNNAKNLISRLAKQAIFSWAVRSSSEQEDQIDRSNAGLCKSYTAIPAQALEHYAQRLLLQSSSVILQEYVHVKISGVAFIRHLSLDLEWIESAYATVTSGHMQVQRLYLELDENNTVNSNDSNLLPLEQCLDFLRAVQSCFHFVPLDIEWGWNGRHFYLFQVRPITEYSWRRVLSSANIDELLAPRPSLLMENTQRRASYSIPQIYALWDTRVLQDGEPFSAKFDDASYLNMDVYLAMLRRWGLSSSVLSQAIGAAVPLIPASALRLLRNLPVFFRMIVCSRREIRGFDAKLHDFEAELENINTLASAQQSAILQQWFLRLYVYIVQTNLCLNAAIVTALTNRLNNPLYVYSPAAHRVSFESDPASPRPVAFDPNSTSLPATLESLLPATKLERLWDRLGLPGNQGYYIARRELFRDSYTRLYYRLHFMLKKLDSSGLLFSEYFNARKLSGSFWQHNGMALLKHWPKQDKITDIPSSPPTLIYPGAVKGRVAKEILIVNRLDPGEFNHYRKFKAVIARGGGYLSHAAILLRELKIPSAFIPDVPELAPGTEVEFCNGCLDYQSDSISCRNSSGSVERQTIGREYTKT